MEKGAGGKKKQHVSNRLAADLPRAQLRVRRWCQYSREENRHKTCQAVATVAVLKALEAEAEGGGSDGEAEGEV